MPAGNPSRRAAAYDHRRAHRDGARSTPAWDWAWARLLARLRGQRTVDVFKRATALRTRVVNVLEGFEDALWLGVLTPADLVAIDQRHYADALVLINGERLRWSEPQLNAAGLAHWERDVILRFFRPGGRVVVIGAGAGREVRSLIDTGYDAVGYEPNHHLLAAGLSFVLEPHEHHRLRPVARDRFPSHERCAAVLVGWGAYAHIPGRGQRVAFLRAARAGLDPGGVIALSFAERPGAGAGMRAGRRASSALRRLRGQGPTEVGDVLEPGFRHCFTRAEILAELTEAGFALEEYSSGPQPHAVGRRPG